jgi:hypothetical protein
MLASMMHSQTKTPMNVDRTTKTAGKALSPAGVFDEFMIASGNPRKVPASSIVHDFEPCVAEFGYFSPLF